MEMNKRLYSRSELASYFGEREYFKNMHTNELKHVFGYIARKINIDETSILRAVCSSEEVCHLDDGEVYSLIQDMRNQSATIEEDTYKNDSEAMSKGYKSMCRNHEFNFKEPLVHVLDFGCANDNLLSILREVMYAKRVSGIAVDKYRIEDGELIIQQLDAIPERSVDMVICNSTLHSVQDSNMKQVLNNIIRICSKYVIIKDFELGENFDTMIEMAITREIESGVAFPSDIPDLIASDPDGINTPDIFYNLEFSIESAIKYLCSNGFAVVSNPEFRKNMGNVKAYILKREDFIPWSLEDNHFNQSQSNNRNWNYVHNKSKQQQEIADIKHKLTKECNKFAKKAIYNPTRDERTKEVTTILNKITDLNYDKMIELLERAFKTNYLNINSTASQDKETFIESIAERLATKAKASRTMFAVSAAIFAKLVNLEYELTQSQLILESVTSFIDDLLNKLKVASESDEIYYDLVAHSSNCIKFLTIAACKHNVGTEELSKNFESLFAHAPNSSDYVEIIITGLELSPNSTRQLYSEELTDLINICESSRSKCLIKNYLEI